MPEKPPSHLHHPALAVGSTRRFYLPSLDGARGVAISFVLLDHLSSAKIIPFPWLRGIGHVGVYLFFSLSAFLLTAPFCQKSTEELCRWETWSVYLWRRVLRIYPVYILVLLTKHFTQADISWSTVRDHLLLRRGDNIFWTMTVETKYYLILPVLVLIFLVALRRKAFSGVLGAMGLALALPILFRIEGRWWSLVGHVLRPFFWLFLLGSAAGWLFALTVAHPWRGRRLAWLWEMVAMGSLAISIFGLSKILCHQPTSVMSVWQQSILAAGIGWALFVFAHLHGVGVVKGLLEWRPLRYMGMISYSLYLWHKPVIDLFSVIKKSRDLPWLRVSSSVHALAIISAIVLAGSLSFFAVERPFSKLKARFTRSL